MYQALFSFIKKYTEFVRPGLDIDPAIHFPAKLRGKKFGANIQEPGDLLYLILLDKNATFSIAAIPARLALKCLQNKRLK